MKAIILAAGEGKRMRPLTLQVPKPMIRVLGKPILEHSIESLPAQITELIIVIGYKGEQVQRYFGNQFKGRKITYVIQEKPQGTGHALLLCKKFIDRDEKFLFMPGDDLYSKTSLESLLKYDHAVLVHTHDNPRRFGVIETDAQNRVVGFEETPEQPKSNLVSMAVFVLSGKIFDYPAQLSRVGEYWATDQIRQMMKEHTFFAQRADFWMPIGYPHDIDAAEEILRDKHRIPAEQKRATPVIILAGGKGTRMPQDEKHKPKCLVDIAGKPMLQWQLEDLYRQGFTNIKLSLGHKAEMVIDWLKQHKYDTVAYSVEAEPLGTGGAIKLALGDLREPFLALNCDDFADVSLASLMRHSSDNAYNVISVREIADARTFGLIECDEFHKVCAFKEKDPSATKGLVSIGHYYLQPDIFDGFGKKFSIEVDVFPKVAAAGKLVVHRHTGNYWVTANDAAQLKDTRNHFAKLD